LDSHLKPYKCKVSSCKHKSLVRHEKEVHGIHGRGDNPFICLYEECDRATPGNGFPRKWNRLDHIEWKEDWDKQKPATIAWLECLDPSDPSAMKQFMAEHATLKKLSLMIRQKASRPAI
jgi:hypothetical protein